MNSNDPSPDSDATESGQDFRDTGDQPTDEEVPVSGAAKECDTTREAFDDLVRAAKDAFQSGSDDARDAARSAIPKAREGFYKGVHELAYGLAYGLTFGSTLAREFTPEVMRSGFAEGSSAGRDAAEGFVRKQRQSNAERRHRARSTGAPVKDPEAPCSPDHGAMRDDDDGAGEPVFV